MFSQWPSHEQDELFEFISPSPNCPQHEQTLLMMHQNSIHKVLPLELDVNNPPPPPPPFYNDSDIISPPLPITVINNADSKPKQAGRRRKPSVLDNFEETPKDFLKKIIHRDVERQRRQEMAVLYETLRSLIPSQHFEEKRSISDHIDATVRYISNQKKKMDELKKKRDKLREWFINAGCEQPSITVKSCMAGMEITITSGSKLDLPLSRILSLLISEGMSVKSCISTRVNQSLLNVIESEVNEEKSINPNELQEKLMEIVRHHWYLWRTIQT